MVSRVVLNFRNPKHNACISARCGVVKEYKYLGLIFDSKLSFIPHIKTLKTKCLKTLNILKVVVSNTHWEADRTMLLHLYRALVRSKLDYGSIIYILNNLILFIIKALDSDLGLFEHHWFQASMLKLMSIIL